MNLYFSVKEIKGKYEVCINGNATGFKYNTYFLAYTLGIEEVQKSLNKKEIE